MMSGNEKTLHRHHRIIVYIAIGIALTGIGCHENQATSSDSTPPAQRPITSQPPMTPLTSGTQPVIPATPKPITDTCAGFKAVWDKTVNVVQAKNQNIKPPVNWKIVHDAGYFFANAICQEDDTKKRKDTIDEATNQLNKYNEEIVNADLDTYVRKTPVKGSPYTIDNMLNHMGGVLQDQKSLPATGIANSIRQLAAARMTLRNDHIAKLKEEDVYPNPAAEYFVHDHAQGGGGPKGNKKNAPSDADAALRDDVNTSMQIPSNWYQQFMIDAAFEQVKAKFGWKHPAPPGNSPFEIRLRQLNEYERTKDAIEKLEQSHGRRIKDRDASEEHIRIEVRP